MKPYVISVKYSYLQLHYFYCILKNFNDAGAKQKNSVHKNISCRTTETIHFLDGQYFCSVFFFFFFCYYCPIKIVYTIM
jgi:hypothetical protein